MAVTAVPSSVASRRIVSAETSWSSTSRNAVATTTSRSTALLRGSRAGWLTRPPPHPPPKDGAGFAGSLRYGRQREVVAGEPVPPDLAVTRPPFDVGRVVGLAQGIGGDVDSLGMRAERGQVEPEHLGRRLADHPARLGDRDVVVGLGEPLAGAGPGAFRMREIVAPQHVVQADLVAHADLAPFRVGRSDEAVAVEQLTRPSRDAER